MAYIAPISRTTSDLITAAIWNADIVANEIAINAGAIAIASQAIGDLIVATSGSQLGRVADVATGQVLVSGGVATAPAYSASPSVTALTVGTTLGVTGVSTLTGGAVVQTLTVGKGGGAVATNTAMGVNALSANTTGASNTAVGASALTGNTTGAYNVAVGGSALQSNTTGADNTAVGYAALNSNTIGTANTAAGYAALQSNTTGTQNTAVGVNALNANTIGASNTAVGAAALTSNTTGSSNTAVGRDALNANTIGTNNAAVGRNALTSNTTGTSNTAMGRDALSALTTYTNASGLGYQAAVTGNNQVQCGNASTAFYAYGAYNDRSDARDKALIRDTVLGLEFITALRPRDFKWDYRDDYKPVAPVAPVAPSPPDAPAEPVVPSAPRLLDDRATDADRDAYDEAVRVYTEAVEVYPDALTVYTDAAEAYALVVAAQNAAHTAALDVYHAAHEAWLTAVDLGNIVHDGTHTRTRYHHGLIAQEVQAVIAESGVDFGGFQHHTIKGGQDVMSLGYTELISPLIKAVQELKAQFDAYVQTHP